LGQQMWISGNRKEVQHQFVTAKGVLLLKIAPHKIFWLCTKRCCHFFDQKAAFSFETPSLSFISTVLFFDQSSSGCVSCNGQQTHPNSCFKCHCSQSLIWSCTL